jgi:hypothetical protein
MHNDAQAFHVRINAINSACGCDQTLSLMNTTYISISWK